MSSAPAAQRVPRAPGTRAPRLRFAALTSELWNDFERLFGERGACGGCWCMSWRLNRRHFEEQKGEGNKKAFRAIVESGAMPGILAYENGEPVGWCAVAPRQEYVVLQRSRVWSPLDSLPVWSVSCFFVKKSHRQTGISVSLLKAAIEFARRRGARIIEGYPLDLKHGRLPDAFVWTGLASAFRKAGFVEAARRSSQKPILRYKLKSPARGTS